MDGTAHIEVERTPHNDEMLVQVKEDLKQHADIVRHVLEQAEEYDAPVSSVIAALHTAWVQNEEMTRERMASLLALSLVINQVFADETEAREWMGFVSKIAKHPLFDQAAPE